MRKAARAFGSPAEPSIRRRSLSRVHNPRSERSGTSSVATLGSAHSRTRRGLEVVDLPGADLDVGEEDADGRRNGVHRALLQEAPELARHPAGIDGGQQDRCAAGVDSRLQRLGRAADGSIEVPAEFAVAGWFAEGARPGQPGPAVILGHIDSRTGPAVFYRVPVLQWGVQVLVDRAGGSAVAFRVRWCSLQGSRAYTIAGDPGACRYGLAATTKILVRAPCGELPTVIL